MAEEYAVHIKIIKCLNMETLRLNKAEQVGCKYREKSIENTRNKEMRKFGTLLRKKFGSFVEMDYFCPQKLIEY